MEFQKPRTCDVKITENVDFTGLLLSDSLLAGLKQAGFVRPSPIQLKAIPLGRCGLDLVVQAKSGTGKTCVFSVVALESIALDAANTQVLVLAPTREIAVQIWEVMNSLGSAIPGLRCYTFIGGMPLADDKVKLRKCHIAVGTPGRVKQLIEHQALSTESVRLFILDEADKLMEDGFQETINWIYSSLPENKQMLALSATFPEVLAQHLTAYMRNPTFVRLNTTDPALLGIRQYYKQVPFHPLPQKAFEAKCQALMCLLSEVVFQQCLVFSNYQLRAESLSDILNAKGWPATYISGSQDQQDRLIAMAKLKKFKCRILISTDLTSRGIDAENVNLVVNLDIPYDHETYLHRIGRAGRFGTYGATVSFVALGKETANLRAIERKVNTKISALPEPIPSDLAKSSGFVNIDDLVITQPLDQVAANMSSAPVQENAETGTQNQSSHTLKQLNGAHNDAQATNESSNGATEGTIPDLIDCISENVQIGYAEAESLLDGALAGEAHMDTPDEGTNGTFPTPDMGNSDISTTGFSLSEQEGIEPSRCSKEAIQKSPRVVSDVVKTDAQDCTNEESSVTRDVDTESLSKLQRILHADIPTETITPMLPSIALPVKDDCDTKNPHKSPSYKEIMADLKHFRETGKLLYGVPSYSSSNSTAENLVQNTNSFDQVVKDVAKFLEVLYVDPVKDTMEAKPKETTQFITVPAEISGNDSNREQTMRRDTQPLTGSLLSENSDKVANQNRQIHQDDSASALVKAGQRKANTGARPKEVKKKHKETMAQGNKHKATRGTREDRLLGLDYMKKLTACLDQPSSEDSIDESTGASACSSRSTRQGSEIEDDDYDERSNNEDRSLSSGEQQGTYLDAKWAPINTEPDTNHHLDYVEDEYEENYSAYQSHNPWFPEDVDDCESHWQKEDAAQGMRRDGPQWCGPEEENLTGYHNISHMSNGWYPRDLWVQCHTLLGSINAAQASQYAWFCQQQYMYHSGCAKYYADLYRTHAGNAASKGVKKPNQQKSYSRSTHKRSFIT